MTGEVPPAAAHGPLDRSPSGLELTDDAFLSGALQILQPRPGYRAGIDAVLLAAATELGDRSRVPVLDIGTGVGVAGLCLARRCATAQVTLVERDPLLADLAARNIVRNGLHGRVHAVCADILGRAEELAAAGIRPHAFEVVIANPPWLEEGRGRAASDRIKARANAMPPGHLDRWIRFAARVAVDDGTLLLIHRADALKCLLDVVDGRFGAIELLPIHPRRGVPANRILLRGRKGSRAPLVMQRGIVVHRPEGGYQLSIEAVLRHGAPLAWVGTGQPERV